MPNQWRLGDPSPNLIPYREHVMQLIPYFDEITFIHILREKNQLANALGTLSSMFKVKWANEAPSIIIECLDEPTHCLELENTKNDRPWYYDIQRYLETKENPEWASTTDKKTLQKFHPNSFSAGKFSIKKS